MQPTLGMAIHTLVTATADMRKGRLFEDPGADNFLRATYMVTVYSVSPKVNVNRI